MRKFKCPKCGCNEVVLAIRKVIEYQTFDRMEDDGYISDVLDYGYDYDEAENESFTCSDCGFYLGSNQDDVFEVFFKEAD